MADVEKQNSSDLKDCGYGYVASMMAIKNSPLAIFRNFGQLRMLNLLSLQAELIHLEEQFQIRSRANANRSNGDFAERFEYSFSTLRDAYHEFEKYRQRVHSEPHISKEQLAELQKGYKQYELLLKIREKLKEYGSYCLAMLSFPSAAICFVAMCNGLMTFARQDNFACSSIGRSRYARFIYIRMLQVLVDETTTIKPEEASTKQR